jgi:hypothetical protein
MERVVIETVHVNSNKSDNSTHLLCTSTLHCVSTLRFVGSASFHYFIGIEHTSRRDATEYPRSYILEEIQSEFKCVGGQTLLLQ